MASELIFITGATGFIGAATAKSALEAGYRLRISVRNSNQIPRLQDVFSAYLNRMDFVVVPDITIPGAFAGKMDGASYVFHLASPLANKGGNKENYFGPAKQGTLEALKEASVTESVKKVVVMSSIASMIPLSGIPEGGVIKEDNDWDLSVDENGDFGDPQDPTTAFVLYSASKILAANATWDFVAKYKPKFSLVTLHPSFVYGHDIIQGHNPPTGTNAMLFRAIMLGTPLPSLNSVHVEDVAQAHLQALAPSIQNEKFLLSGPPYTWKDIVDVLERDYKGVPWKARADTPGTSRAVDTTKAQKVLDITFKGIDVQVKDVLDQQLPIAAETKESL